MTEKREHGYRIRLSDEEYERLQANAKSMGITMSELIRRTAIEGQSMSPVVLDMEPIRKMLFELQKQGGNLNQLAREANRFGMSKDLAVELDQLVAKIKNNQKQIRKLISDIREGRLNL